jgi:hypothetical protein
MSHPELTLSSGVQPSLAFGELWLGKPKHHAKAASP